MATKVWKISDTIAAADADRWETAAAIIPDGGVQAVGKDELVWNAADPKHGLVSGVDSTAAFQTLAAAVIAAKRILYIPGNFQVVVSAPTVLTSGFAIVGDTRGKSQITSTHAGPVFTTAGPSTNVLEGSITDVQFIGPGVDVVGSCGFDLAGVSTSKFHDLAFSGYETGIRIRSAGAGSGGRYNRFHNVRVASCVTGFSIEGSACNANLFYGCRVGAATVVGLFIDNSTEVCWFGGELENCLLAVHAAASLGANNNLQNALFGVRFESNTQNWQIDANVMDFHIVDPLLISTPSVANVDNGTRTTVIGSGKIANYFQTTSDPLGSFRFDRVGGAPPSGPVVNARDLGTVAGTPVGVQASVNQAGFPFRALGIDGATPVWSVDSAGAMRLAEAATPANPPANMATIYAKDNGSGKTQVVARFPDGSEIILATQP